MTDVVFIQSGANVKIAMCEEFRSQCLKLKAALLNIHTQRRLLTVTHLQA